MRLCVAITKNPVYLKRPLHSNTGVAGGRFLFVKREIIQIRHLDHFRSYVTIARHPAAPIYIVGVHDGYGGINAPIASILDAISIVINVPQQLGAMGSLVARTSINGGSVMSEIKLAVGANITVGGDIIAKEPAPVIDEIRIVKDLAALETNLYHGVGIRPGGIRIPRIVGRLVRNVGIGRDCQAAGDRGAGQRIDKNIVLGNRRSLVVVQEPPGNRSRKASRPPELVPVNAVQAAEGFADRSHITYSDNIGNLLGNSRPGRQAGGGEVPSAANISC